MKVLHSRKKIDNEEAEDGKSEVNSVISEMLSDAGTQYSETQITATFVDNISSAGANQDVANLKSLQHDDLTSKSEEEQRRWFYSQCLNIKLSCPDK